jgi:putative Ca2+/H+ antiporter (TMEM165/GDT1 family)
VFGDRHAIVTLIVIERMAYLSVFLNIMTVMTVMTLMTVIYGSFLDRGRRLYFRDSLSCFVT